MWSNEMKQVWTEAILELPRSIDEASDLRELEISEVQVDGASSVTIETQHRCRLDGVVIGTLVRLNDSGTPLVDFPSNLTGSHVQARCTVTLGAKDVGGKVALMFEGADSRKPIIMGLLQHPDENQSDFLRNNSNETQNALDIQVDGERLILTAKQEIVLRCGKASITLTHAGKVLIHGEYLLSRSSGVNRIKGGSVQIN
jgi:Domain of unknown function (DUF6484)